MSITEAKPPADQVVQEPPDPRRWKALAVLAIVQVMLLLDATVVNVALPSLERDLHMSPATLTWAVSSYLLAAGCLLFTGGKLADLLGRLRMFYVGTIVFAVASLTAGLAQNSQTLIAGRVLQGIGEALAAPAALSLVTTLFTSDEERPKAFGIWGSLAGVGSTLGVLLGGVLVQQFSWRAIFLINPAIAIVALVAIGGLVDESKSESKPRLNIRNAVIVTAGLVSLIQGLMIASHSPWTSASVWGFLLLGVILLGGFCVAERTTDNPMIPPRFFEDRTRVIGYSTVVVNASSSAAVFFVLVLYMQQILGYSPLAAGLAWLPFCLMFMPGLFMSMSMTAKQGLRVTLATGLLVSALGVALMARFPIDGSYLTDVLPAMLITAFGFGLTAPAMQNAATSNLGDDAGLGSGVMTTVQQLGQSVGLSVLVAIGLAVTHNQVGNGTAQSDASVAGYQVAMIIAALVLAIGAVAGPLLVRERRPAQDS